VQIVNVLRHGVDVAGCLALVDGVTLQLFKDINCKAS